MSQLLFSNAALLAGLVALGIPIVIHLLMRRNKQRLRFSTIQFFIQQDEKSDRHRKLRNLLLLATRLLLVSLLVLAFARPYLPELPFSKENTPPKQLVFVVDRSASMQAENGARWHKATELIISELQKLSPADRIALIGCSSQVETLSPFAPAERVKSIVSETKPDFGAADLSDGLQEAVNLIALNPNPASAIYLVSDLQQSGCLKLQTVAVPKSIDLKILAVTTSEAANLSLSQLQIAKGALQVNVANYSEEGRTTTLDVIADGKVVATQKLLLGAAVRTNATLPLPELPAGWQTVEARLAGQDTFPFDNTADLSTYVSPKLRVICVEPRQAKRSFEEETFFISSALQPSKTTDIVDSQFELQKVQPSQLAGTLIKHGSQFPLVICAGLKNLPEDSALALQQYVKEGGSLLMFVAEGFSGNRYNTEFGELLPATLKKVEGDASRPEQFWHIGDYDKVSGAFAAFREPNSGDLSLPEFRLRYLVVPTPTAQVLATFNDGMPLLVARKSGRGRVLLVNTSANTAWTDWPKRKTFVPWLHGVSRWLAQSSMTATAHHSRSITCGWDDPIDLGPSFSKSNFRLQSPDGTETATSSDDRGRIAASFPNRGVYTLFDLTSNVVAKFDVSIPPEESDLLSSTAEQFEKQLVRTIGFATKSSSTAVLESITGEKPLWRMLLIVGMILLFVEILFANRTVA